MLHHGLYFAYENKKVNIPKFLASIEAGLKKVNQNDSHAINTRISKVLINNNCSGSQDCFPELKVLKTLSHNQNIVITHADKGHVAVVLDRSDSHTKALYLLNDVSTYELLKNDFYP